MVQGSTQGHWRFPEKSLEEGYAYLMTHPGTPSVFMDHLDDEKLRNTIVKLGAIRKRMGIHCRSQASPSLTLAISRMSQPTSTMLQAESLSEGPVHLKMRQQKQRSLAI